MSEGRPNTNVYDFKNPPVVIPVLLRDYFAAKAMHALMIQHSIHIATLAKMAYEQADAMLNERET